MAETRKPRSPPLRPRSVAAETDGEASDSTPSHFAAALTRFSSKDRSATRRAGAVNQLLVAMIVINLVATALQSVPALDARYGTVFTIIEWLSLILFTVEYLLRVWVAADDGNDLRARLKYVLSPIGIVDLLAVAPFWIALFSDADLRFLLVFRMVRFLKLARYSPGMRSLLDAIYTERRALVRLPCHCHGRDAGRGFDHAGRRRGRRSRKNSARYPTRCGGRS